ncbi:MAG: sodium-dependent bicarbonate transport family permease [Clostridia bacterium]|nr:sodium-dependent bicarbonate transport family permease [Clostridia bacterium]
MFMLKMGMLAASKLWELKKAGIFLLVFGILVPLVNALLGILIGDLAG